MNWQKGVVTAHVQHHDDERARLDNPPWTRTVRLDDGTERTFTWAHLCRNGTYATNTAVGASVWVRDDDGAVSAPEPSSRDKCPTPHVWTTTKEGVRVLRCETCGIIITVPDASARSVRVLP